MRLRSSRYAGGASSLSAAILLIGAAVTPALALPHAPEGFEDTLKFLLNRRCQNPCGAQNQYCCNPGQACATEAGIAICRDPAAGGGFGLYPTTWTQTHTYTSTSTSYFPAAQTPAPGNCIPAPGSGQIACGSICCASWQYCADFNKPQCSANGPAPPGPPVQTTWMPTTITSGGVVITTGFSAPYRVTSGTGPITTGVVPPPTDTAEPVTGGTASSLSPGAIAGIVIGVIAGVILLLLICACCLVRGLWNGIAAILGFGRKKETKRETIIEEERYHSHHGGSAHGRRERHGGWFGFGGGRPRSADSRREKEKKKSSGAGWLGLAGAAGTILLLLGLRRDKNKNKKSTSGRRSEVSSSYFTDSYYGSDPSSRSSRTRHSRRTSGTRHSRGPGSRVPPSRSASRR